MIDFGKLDFAVSFSPLTAFPLDARYYFESLASANLAAQSAVEVGSSDGRYFFGENIVVVENGEAKMYIIQPDKSLKEVGGNILINEKVFLKDAEGKLDLVGFASAVAGAQLTKGEDGNLKWVKPDTTTVEGLSTAVESLKTTVGGADSGLVKDVNDLKTAVGGADSGLVKDVADLKTSVAGNTTNIAKNAGDIATNAGNITNNANEIAAVKQDLADNYDTSAEVDQKIAAKISSTYKAAGSVAFAALPALAAAIEGNVYNISDEFTTTDDFVEAAGTKYPAGTNIVCIKVGEAYKWDVLAGFVDLSAYETAEAAGAKYATKTELTNGLAGKVDVVAGKGLSTEDYTSEDKTKLAGIAAGAQVNVIDAVSEEFEISAEGKVLSVKGIASSKITGLDTSLEGKVDKVVGSSLVPDGDIAKLQGLANIKSVASGELQISETGELGVSAIDASKVTGLSNALNGKISGVKVNGVELIPDAEKKVDISLAATDSVGLIKGARADSVNGVVIDENGIGSVKKVDMAILEPNTEVTFILNGGNAPAPSAG